MFIHKSNLLAFSLRQEHGKQCFPPRQPPCDGRKGQKRCAELRSLGRTCPIFLVPGRGPLSRCCTASHLLWKTPATMQGRCPWLPLAAPIHVLPGPLHLSFHLSSSPITPNSEVAGQPWSLLTQRWMSGTGTAWATPSAPNAMPRGEPWVGGWP